MRRTGPHRARSIAILSFAALGLIAASAPAAAQALLDFWIPNGPVNATAYDPARARLYVGGSFDRIGAPSGAGALFHSTTGAVLNPLLRIGQLGAVVRTVVADGSGGWFIGGQFSEIQGTARQNLAHVDAAGSLSSWNPGANGPVHSLALSGGVLYVGGAFATLAGVGRTRLGALDPATGAALAWAPAANDTVKFVGAFSGVVYVGGDFTQIDATTRNHVAALNTSGALATWNPNADAAVRAIYRSGTNVALGGDFLNVGGSAHAHVAVVLATTGAAAPAVITANGPVYAFEADASRLFIAGDFTAIGGAARVGLAAFNLTTFVIDAAWNASLDAAARDLFLLGSQLYLAGDFSQAGGSRRGGSAAVSASSATLQAWDPRSGSPSYCVSVTATNAFVGGGFVVVNYENSAAGFHHNLAAYDFNPSSATFGRPLPVPLDAYYPGNSPAEVDALAFLDPYLYVGGSFSGYNGVARSYAAKSHVDTWATELWAPVVNGPVYTIGAGDSQILLGGLFTSPGPGLAGFDPLLGNTLPTLPLPYPGNSLVTVAVNRSAGLGYYGGVFDGVGASPLRGFATVSLFSQTLTAAAPFPLDSIANAGFATVNIKALEVSTPELIYVGGWFFNYGVFARRNLLAIDMNTGKPTSWAPNPDIGVYALGRAGTRLYAGGQFGSVFGQPRTSLAGFDLAVGGALLDWAPTVSVGGTTGTPFSIAAAPNRVAVGGSFNDANGVFNPYFAVFDDLSPGLTAVGSAPASESITLSVTPNPLRRSGWVTFHLARPDEVALDLLDVQGRVVRSVLSEHLSAGAHQVPLDAQGLGAGIYWARLRTGDRSRSVRWTHVR